MGWQRHPDRDKALSLTLWVNSDTLVNTQRDIRESIGQQRKFESRRHATPVR